MRRELLEKMIYIFILECAIVPVHVLVYFSTNYDNMNYGRRGTRARSSTGPLQAQTKQMEEKKRLKIKIF